MLKLLRPPKPEIDFDKVMLNLEEQLTQAKNGPPTTFVSERLGAKMTQSEYEAYKPIDTIDRLRNTMLDMTEAEWVEFGRQFGTFPKRMPTRAHFIATLKLWAIDAFKDQVQGPQPSPGEYDRAVSAVNRFLSSEATLHLLEASQPGCKPQSES